ncbi:unnamed protein product, partial [Heterobilharzia americana]
MPNEKLDLRIQLEQEFSSSVIICGCDLCHARLYVSEKQSVDDYYSCVADQTDAFYLLPIPKLINLYPQTLNMSVMHPLLCQMPLTTDLTSLNCNQYEKCAFPLRNKVDLDTPSFSNLLNNSWRCSVGSSSLEWDLNARTTPSIPQAYISKDSILHIRLSNYVSVERSLCAYRLINYRNNSALALNESGQYGYAYHYNCHGLINMHRGKLSITFDKDRQVLLRSEKPSFVKNEVEFYTLRSHHWTACRPVSMDTFDRDETPEILKKSDSGKSHDDTKLRELVTSSEVHKDGCGMIIFLGDSKIEQKVNGDVILSWVHEDRSNSLLVSPLSGSFSLSTKNLEILATPKAETYISFTDFFVHVGSQQMTVSSGAVSGKCNFSKGHLCLLRLTSRSIESQGSETRQYCAYSQLINQNARQNSSNKPWRHSHSANSL